MPGISKMKNFIIVTGGAGFVGSNLIKSLLKKTNKKTKHSLINIGTGIEKSISDYAKFIMKHLGVKLKLKFCRNFEG